MRDPRQAGMVLPNFIIVGAMRAGTTGFCDVLAEHPEIYAHPAEIHFFSADRLYSGGLGKYSEYFKTVSNEKAVGEKSPPYCFSPTAPERIQRDLPGVRLIWLFRNPTARSYSHYWHSVSKGIEYRTFEEGIEREKTLPDSELSWRYVERSIYARQVERYLKYFRPEEMLFLLFEDLRKRPQEEFGRTSRFLEVDGSFQFQFKDERQNFSRLPRNLKWNYMGYRYLSRFGPGPLRVFRRLMEVSGKYPPIKPETKARLDEIFAPHNQRLAELTGLDLSSWSNGAK